MWSWAHMRLAQLGIRQPPDTSFLPARSGVLRGLCPHCSPSPGAQGRRRPQMCFRPGLLSRRLEGQRRGERGGSSNVLTTSICLTLTCP